MSYSTAPKTLQEVQSYALGEWKSLSTELRPTEDRTGSGKIDPTFLTRHFHFQSEETFTGIITMFADQYGDMPILRFEFKGHLK